MLDSDKDCVTKKIREARMKDYFSCYLENHCKRRNWFIRGHYQARGSNKLGKDGFD